MDEKHAQFASLALKQNKSGAAFRHRRGLRV
jgi:hypothetical protein